VKLGHYLDFAHNARIELRQIRSRDPILFVLGTPNDLYVVPPQEFCPNPKLQNISRKSG